MVNPLFNRYSHYINNGKPLFFSVVCLSGGEAIGLVFTGGGILLRLLSPVHCLSRILLHVAYAVHVANVSHRKSSYCANECATPISYKSDTRYCTGQSTSRYGTPGTYVVCHHKQSPRFGRKPNTYHLLVVVVSLH